MDFPTSSGPKSSKKSQKKHINFKIPLMILVVAHSRLVHGIFLKPLVIFCFTALTSLIIEMNFLTF